MSVLIIAEQVMSGYEIASIILAMLIGCALLVLAIGWLDK